MGELKPCPFCGGEAKYKYRHVANDDKKQTMVGIYFVQCQLCLAQSRSETVYFPYEDDTGECDARSTVGMALDLNTHDSVQRAWNRRDNGDNA